MACGCNGKTRTGNPPGTTGDILAAQAAPVDDGKFALIIDGETVSRHADIGGARAAQQLAGDGVIRLAEGLPA